MWLDELMLHETLELHPPDSEICPRLGNVETASGLHSKPLHYCRVEKNPLEGLRTVLHGYQAAIR